MGSLPHRSVSVAGGQERAREPEGRWTETRVVVESEDRATRWERWNGTQGLQVVPGMTLPLEPKREGENGAKKRKLPKPPKWVQNISLEIQGAQETPRINTRAGHNGLPVQMLRTK